MKLLFNNEWEFTKQAMGCSIEEVQANKYEFNKVDIPHDWVIYDTAFFSESCVGWYRKQFTIEASTGYKADVKNNRYLINFEGIYMDSTVYVNGIIVGEWKYGYSTFEFDITTALKDGENEIVVKVVLQVPNSRWYTGGGINRNVWLRVVPNTYLASDGIYISTEKSGSSWKVRIESDIIDSSCNYADNIQQVLHTLEVDGPHSIRHTVFDADGKVITCIEGNQKSQMLTLSSPSLWDIDTPYLYTLKTELLRNDIPIDEVDNKFGCRTLRFEPDSGFYLNERHVKLHGACQHHDLGALGSAQNKTAIKRQLLLLKEMGVNSVRTTHNMCAIELLELADEMGILIVSEDFDTWEKPKNQFDYARFFTKWVERDVASWVRRDRNHPCVIMWSIGNEIYDTHADAHGQEITRKLMELVYRHDPYHNASVTIGSNFMPWENAQNCADIVKLAGYNYGEKYYKLHHEQHKDWIIYGSETASVVQSRGIYHFPLNTEILSDDDQQCSSLGNSITSWGARSIEKCIIDDRDATFSAGMFIWSGFDYIGEPTPYHTKNSYFGQLDTAGFKKDSFYIYQAAWTDYRIAPMVHIFPYWDFNEGQSIDVRVCSNAPKVELFFNGSSQGTFEIDHQNGTKLIGDWQLPYQKGELRAVAYDLEDNMIAEDIQRSFSDVKSLVLKPDKQKLLANGRDLIFVEISAKDCNGNPVLNANNRVNVNVTGAGRLVGLDNGDSTDYDSYKGTSRRLFSGKLLAIIAAKTTSGEITMEVSSEGITSSKINLHAEECEIPSGITAIEQNADNSQKREIPIRKIEIISPLGTRLNGNLREVSVELKIYPENATYQDVAWRVTNASGVDSNIVTINSDGKKATIQALGDGTFYVRATTKNGADKPSLISALDFEIAGLGMAYFNPYDFVSGSLYSHTIGEVSSGNDRGVATARDGETVVVYDKLDFGVIGSDEITIPIFELGSVPTRLEIWEGTPNMKGSQLLADVIYHKSSIWNVYQEETYHLSKRLIGITSIAFVLRSKVHIKGFSFKKLEKAYEKLPIRSYSSLYGDDYTLEQDSITGIGNNVTITFDNMDFSIRGIRKLIICGRCMIDNSIIVCFKGEDGEMKQLIEFPSSSEYVERQFTMENVLGLQNVEFLFLPGCQFDFKWFRFE